jgi:hypothetical protein
LEKRNELVEAESEAIQARQDHDQAVKRYSIMLAVAAALSAIWMFWAWRVSQKKKRTIWRQNQRIQGINEELNEKNQNIQSSLGYAQTIQSAILPSEQDLQAILPDSFLLYKPLDTVSGDLPFIKRCGERVFVAAIDCTGHGVPAAMMTFIAYYGLNELLTKDPNASSAELLDRLHEHVKRTMEARTTTGSTSAYVPSTWRRAGSPSPAPSYPCCTSAMARSPASRATSFRSATAISSAPQGTRNTAWTCSMAIRSTSSAMVSSTSSVERAVARNSP